MNGQSRFDTDAEFRRVVSRLLEDLLEQADDIDADIEPRLTSGNLSVTFEDGAVFMLSQQTPTHELWLSANYTAWHFGCAQGTWLERDSSEPMFAVLSRLMSDKLSIPVHFEP
jgi:iron donor protein CyaY